MVYAEILFSYEKGLFVHFKNNQLMHSMYEMSVRKNMRKISGLGGI